MYADYDGRMPHWLSILCGVLTDVFNFLSLNSNYEELRPIPSYSNIALSNYEYNKARDKFCIIDDQHKIDMKFGRSTIASSGCGLVAIYNMWFLSFNKFIPLSDIILDFELAICPSYFDYGVNLWDIEKYLLTKGIKYDYTDSLDVLDSWRSAGDSYIVCYGDFGGLNGHALSALCCGNYFLGYNGRNHNVAFLSLFIPNDKQLAGAFHIRRR